jgi:hypothetical protein
MPVPMIETLIVATVIILQAMTLEVAMIADRLIVDHPVGVTNF